MYLNCPFHTTRFLMVHRWLHRAAPESRHGGTDFAIHGAPNGVGQELLSAFFSYSFWSLRVWLRSATGDGDLVALARFDFRRPPPLATWNQPARQMVDAEVSANGTVHGVADWFAPHTDDEIIVHRGPDGEMMHWQQAVRFIERDLPATQGDHVAIEVLSTDLRIGLSLRRQRSQIAREHTKLCPLHTGASSRCRSQSITM